MTGDTARTAGSKWSYAPLEDVQQTIRGRPDIRTFCLVKGPVEETLPEHVPPEPIALLRLDTDWYKSTAHELKHLYPLLSSGGVLILDDYGHYQGVRAAVNEYFGSAKVLLHRVDYSCRVAIKP